MRSAISYFFPSIALCVTIWTLKFEIADNLIQDEVFGPLRQNFKTEYFSFLWRNFVRKKVRCYVLISELPVIKNIKNQKDLKQSSLN